MLRTVLDTNILVSAWHHPASKDAAIWDAAQNRSFQLVTSPELVRELSRVMRQRFGWLDAAFQPSLRILTRVAEIIQPRSRLSIVTADPDDNRVLECALDGRAELIVSNDRHLLDLKSFRGIPIVVSPDFRRTLGLS